MLKICIQNKTEMVWECDVYEGWCVVEELPYNPKEEAELHERDDNRMQQVVRCFSGENSHKSKLNSMGKWWNTVWI